MEFRCKSTLNQHIFKNKSIFLEMAHKEREREKKNENVKESRSENSAGLDTFRRRCRVFGVRPNPMSRFWNFQTRRSKKINGKEKQNGNKENIALGWIRSADAPGDWSTSLPAGPLLFFGLKW